MSSQNRYVEPVLTYMARKYFELSLALLPIVGGVAANIALFSGEVPPPVWALVYVNLVVFGAAIALLIAYRNRFERRRFRIEGDSVVLPSVVRIDKSHLEELAISSVSQVQGIRRDIGILGRHKQALTEVEIKTNYNGEDVVLVWPIAAFGRKNLEAVEHTLSTDVKHASNHPT